VAAVVIGLGNAWSGDDAAGLLVARALRGRLPEGVALVEHEGEPTALIDAWADAELAIVADATAGGGPPGTVRDYDVSTSPLPSTATGASTHAFTLAQAIELGRALGRLPPRLFVVGVEGRRFEAGAEVGGAVAEGVEAAAARVLELLRDNY
jgi:hydrogenase maturation protease